AASRCCANASAVEAEAEAVERPQPDVAATADVLTLQAPAGRLDAQEAERLGRERQRLVVDEVGRRRHAAAAVDEVEHHIGPEARRGHSEARVAHGISDAPRHRGAPEHAEPAAGVDGATPDVAEADALELREGLEEVAAERGPRLRAALQLSGPLAATVVDRVVPAPQDPVVL